MCSIYSTISAQSRTLTTLKIGRRMTSRVHGSIHTPRCRILPFCAADTAQTALHCKLVACPWHLFPIIDLSTHTSHTSFCQASPGNLCCVHPSRRSGLKLARSIRCTLKSTRNGSLSGNTIHNHGAFSSKYSSNKIWLLAVNCSIHQF